MVTAGIENIGSEMTSFSVGDLFVDKHSHGTLFWLEELSYELS